MCKCARQGAPGTMHKLFARVAPLVSTAHQLSAFENGLASSRRRILIRVKFRSFAANLSFVLASRLTHLLSWASRRTTAARVWVETKTSHLCKNLQKRLARRSEVC